MYSSQGFLQLDGPSVGDKALPTYGEIDSEDNEDDWK